VDVELMLDPEIASALAASPIGAMDFGTWTLETIPGLRASMAAMPLPELPSTTTVHHDVVVEDPTGRSAATVRVYTPPVVASTGRPCLLWIHGGGYMFGTGLTVDARLNRWVEELDCVAVSVEYRLAPEFPYPAPLDDCYAALQWTVEHADELGVDTGRIVVVGASAGGGLAAALSLVARDRGEHPIAYQLLIYPMIDDRNVSPSSRLVGAPIWSRGANLLGWEAYLGHEPGRDGVHEYAAPARAVDLAGLPPTFIGVGTLDVFRDEDIEYASRLLAAGVPTELHVYPGAVHGFEAIVPSAAVSQRCQRDITDALARALSPAATGAGATTGAAGA
jgi:acetyl esterase/lipase